VKVKEVTAWIALVGLLIGGFITLEQRHASAGGMTVQKITLMNQQETLANENRLERLERQLESIHRRRTNGQKWPGDDALIYDLNEEIRIAREYRTALRQQAAQIK